MKKPFELIRDTRINTLNLLQNCDEQKLFSIPKPFSNHIMWNAAHLLATHQTLLYTFSDTKEFLDKSFIKKYSKGTKPDESINLEDLQYVKEHLLSSLDHSIEDYQSNIFGTYKPLKTSFGSTINSIEDAIHYLVLHEAMHFGQIKMIERLLV